MNEGSDHDDEDDDEEEEEEEEEEAMDCIKRNQFDLGGETTMSNLFPEATAVTRLPGNGSREEP